MQISINQSGTTVSFYIPQTPAEAAASVTPTNFQFPQGDVRRYGAVNDGTTDCTAAVNAAIAVCVSNNGGAIYFPGNSTDTNGYYLVKGITNQVGPGTRIYGDGYASKVHFSAVWQYGFNLGNNCIVENLWIDGPAVNAYPWSSASFFRVNDYCTSGGNLYQAIAANNNLQPPNATYWTLIGTAPSTLYNNGVGINAYNVRGVSIRNNWVSGWNFAGISLYAAVDSSVQDNICFGQVANVSPNNSGADIFLYTQGGGTIGQRLMCRGNKCLSDVNNGIGADIQGLDQDLIISDNIIAQLDSSFNEKPINTVYRRYGIIASYHQTQNVLNGHVIVSNNVVKNCGQVGIAMEANLAGVPAHANVSGNMVLNCGFVGGRVSPGNQQVSSFGFGILLNALSAGTTCENNFVSGCAALGDPARLGGNLMLQSGCIAINAVVIQANVSSLATCTISIASPAVVTMSNTFVANQAVQFATSGALPTGLTAGTTYYVSATGLSTSSFQVSATIGGASVNTSGSQSGTQSCGPLPVIIPGQVHVRNNTCINSATHGIAVMYGALTAVVTGNFCHNNNDADITIFPTQMGYGGHVIQDNVCIRNDGSVTGGIPTAVAWNLTWGGTTGSNGYSAGDTVQYNGACYYCAVGTGTAGQTCTISIASPAVVTMANNFVANQAVQFATTGSLPTGLTAGTIYYVSATGLSTSHFQVSATSGGASINTSGSQSGTQTCGPGNPAGDVYNGSTGHWAAASTNAWTSSILYNVGDRVSLSGQAYVCSVSNINVSPTPTNGTWSNSTNYTAGETVLANGAGGTTANCTYICLQNHTASAATQPGQATAWASGTTYAIGNVVSYGGATFQSLTNSNIGHAPPVGIGNIPYTSTNWVQIASSSAAYWTPQWQEQQGASPCIAVFCSALMNRFFITGNTLKSNDYTPYGSRGSSTWEGTQGGSTGIFIWTQKGQLFTIERNTIENFYVGVFIATPIPTGRNFNTQGINFNTFRGLQAAVWWEGGNSAAADCQFCIGNTWENTTFGFNWNGYDGNGVYAVSTPTGQGENVEVIGVGGSMVDPTHGTWAVGDRYVNGGPTTSGAGAYIGKVCTTAGAAGTAVWTTWGAIT